MSVQLTWDVERARDIVTLRPRGMLDALTAPDLRAGLLDCVAEQPAGLLVEVDDLVVADDIGLSVLATVAGQNSRWPGVPIVLSGASPDFAAAADRMGIATHVHVCPDRESALIEFARYPRTPRLVRRIWPDNNAPAAARGVVQEFCQAQRVGGDRDAAQLIASELVTNAVVHAHTPMELTLRLAAAQLHIAVRDGGEGHPRINDSVDEAAESGRGLLLVDALATAWGSLVPSTGKIVWATVRVRPLA